MSICIIKWFESDQLFLWFRYKTFGRIDFRDGGAHFWSLNGATHNTEYKRSIQQRRSRSGHGIRRTTQDYARFHVSSALFSLLPRPATCKSWLFEKRLTFYISVWWSLFFPVRHPHRLAPGFPFVCHHKSQAAFLFCSCSARWRHRCCCYCWISDSVEHIALA